MFVTLCVVSSRLPATTTVVNESCTSSQTDPGLFGPFDADAAAESLDQITLDHCARFGVVGSGRVRVTFSGAGEVARASLSRSSPVATEAAACVARAYSGARIPPFSGPPVTVVKRFTGPDLTPSSPADMGWPPAPEF